MAMEKAEEIGRDERIRTSDPHTPSVMRYQAALRPDRPDWAGAAPSAAARGMQGSVTRCPSRARPRGGIIVSERLDRCDPSLICPRPAGEDLQPLVAPRFPA